ncbi:hypothetical protein [Chromobacterium amazonense]|uniref:Uncharacterized protein n=1 Tax=Chromobacterium amazonense TaxID=1382803 RepID=A0A1S1WWX5_9NEIS|nr:hypothetical protein [Chromobacterium amazonense]KIA79307.1 hypothetical protein QR66_16685 [Chromobacterium piscinae]MBM2883599.1 hypothetical protein [Chromobacterium amazonense]MDE1712245.1 hypothetical protein [Chromobacterium amazonense]MDQ4539035.1 hypothetical protein [Chromobacterium amazonense]OHX11807.1 hypothetical protein BI343_03515 [Chromobacterium amazonense]
MKNLFIRLRSNRKFGIAMLLASTLLFMAMSVLWRGGETESLLLRLLCPMLLLLAMAGQLLALAALLQKPRK